MPKTKDEKQQPTAQESERNRNAIRNYFIYYYL